MSLALTAAVTQLPDDSETLMLWEAESLMSVSTQAAERVSETFFSKLATHTHPDRAPRSGAQTPQTVDLIKHCEIN